MGFRFLFSYNSVAYHSRKLLVIQVDVASDYIALSIPLYLAPAVHRAVRAFHQLNVGT